MSKVVFLLYDMKYLFQNIHIIPTMNQEKYYTNNFIKNRTYFYYRYAELIYFITNTL